MANLSNSQNPPKGKRRTTRFEFACIDNHGLQGSIIADYRRSARPKKLAITGIASCTKLFILSRSEYCHNIKYPLIATFFIDGKFAMYDALPLKPLLYVCQLDLQGR